MSKVVFLPTPDFLPSLKSEVLKSGFPKGSKVCVKLHMGEEGCKTHVKPVIVAVIVEALKELKTRPFLFDTPSLYKGSRSSGSKYLKTALNNGFSRQSIGCPIIVSDSSIKVEGKGFLKTIQASKKVLQSDCLLVISHFKGHSEAGFGGALKNLGMGCVSKESKKQQHFQSRPKLKGKCTSCSTCVKTCPEGLIQLKNSKPKFNYEQCYGCGACIEACPSKALKPKLAGFRTLLAESASAVLQNSSKKVLFINVLMDITRLCDCAGPNTGPILSPNIGILISKDPVSIDKASLELVKKATGKNVFRETHKINEEETLKEAAKLRAGEENNILKKQE